MKKRVAMLLLLAIMGLLALVLINPSSRSFQLGFSGASRSARVGRSVQVVQDIPPDAPRIALTDCRRAYDSAFSKREREILAAARHHLEQAEQRWIDAYYRIKHTTDGFEVFVLYVTGYTDNQPWFLPGGHCTVLLREDGSVIRVLEGA
jgi:hypothetical protein